MAKAAQTPISPTWEGYIKDFIKGLAKVSPSYGTNQIFVDVCRIMSLSLRGALTGGQEKEDIEANYQRFVEKYGAEGMRQVAELFAIVVEALELRRTDFLGQIYERLNATNKGFGQFLTPICVSELLSKVSISDRAKLNEITRMYDPSCGAGVLLLEGARHYIEMGGKQMNLLIYADDLDETACCIAYIQFSLLGYAAIVRHVDSLTQKVYEGPWYTAGYYLHSFPIRLICEKMDDAMFKQKKAEEKKEEEEAEPPPKKKPETIDVRNATLVQGELF